MTDPADEVERLIASGLSIGDAYRIAGPGSAQAYLQQLADKDRAEYEARDLTPRPFVPRPMAHERRERLMGLIQ